jgi:Uma2 family endonuclease
MSHQEYLETERRSETKHEYLRGEVHAMAGGTPEHAALAMALGAELSLALRGRPCRLYSSDLRVWVKETDFATYPDITIICGKLEVAAVDPLSATNPVVLVEILSDSTEAHDRGAKFAHYRHIATLREYVMVSQAEHLIEVFRKNELGIWELHEARAGESFTLTSVGVSLTVDTVYRNPLEPS